MTRTRDEIPVREMAGMLDTTEAILNRIELGKVQCGPKRLESIKALLNRWQSNPPKPRKDTRGRKPR